jgi:hypothetical protein
MPIPHAAQLSWAAWIWPALFGVGLAVDLLRAARRPPGVSWRDIAIGALALAVMSAWWVCLP